MKGRAQAAKTPGWEESVCCLHVRADGLYLHFTDIELFRNSGVKEGLINHVTELNKSSLRYINLPQYLNTFK